MPSDHAAELTHVDAGMMCDACFGMGRHAHFPLLPCSICQGAGKMPIAVAEALASTRLDVDA